MIGKKLRELRMQRGMTRQELANVIGVTDRSVKNWENDVSNPDLTHASAIADLFGISMDELLGRDIDGIFTIGKMREDDRKKLDAVIRAFSAACRDDEG